MAVFPEIEFLNQREREERSAAEAASNEEARDSHMRMADRYADRAWSLLEGFDITRAKLGLRL